MKVSIWMLVACFFSCISGNAQEQSKKQIDSVALLILDKMSSLIGDMNSCTFHLTTASDVRDPVFGTVKRFADHEICLSGPNKMLIDTRSHRGHVKYIYNGNELSLYSFDEHNYGIISTPTTTIETFDSLSSQYGIDFPAADFFYPAFTDDLINHADAIRYLGLESFGGKEYFHILASAKEQEIQIWVSNDMFFLPAKFVITYKNQADRPQYYASFSDWSVNPLLPSTLFEFMPPPGAKQVKILARNER